jgi:sortase B
VFESEDYDLEEDAEPKKEKPEKKNKKKFLKKQTDDEASDGLENKKNINDTIIKIISIICIIGLLISSSVLIANFLFENKQRTIIEDARKNFSFENQEIVKETKQYTEFVEPKEENPDIRGWIYIADTNIDNPVYQAKDNDYYLSHNMNKESSRHGALFFDCNNIISAESSSKNLTIFGHNMRDKSMFGTLEYYRQLNFYKKNPIIKLKTLYQQNNYAIFAVMITNASAKDDNGYVYNFTRGEFSSDEDFLGWIAQAKERSIINTGIEVQADDEILSLSTCCYDFDNARFVVMAKKLLQNESIPEGVNATLNSDVKYPQAWYDKNGRK